MTNISVSLCNSYLILSVLFGHRLLLCLSLALVSVILKPYFHLQRERKKSYFYRRKNMEFETKEEGEIYRSYNIYRSLCANDYILDVSRRK